MGHRHPRANTAQHVVWIVAGATGLQSVLQGLDAILQGSLQRFGLWMAGAIVTAPLAAWAERVKGGGGK